MEEESIQVELHGRTFTVIYMDDGAFSVVFTEGVVVIEPTGRVYLDTDV